jgi:hypothetical protein
VNNLLPPLCPTQALSVSSPSQAFNFQLIFNDALNDLLRRPLAGQLQDCDSPCSILLVLQQQAQELDRSQSSNDRLMKWLGPTVNVLCAFSATLAEGVATLAWYASVVAFAIYAKFLLGFIVVL